MTDVRSVPHDLEARLAALEVRLGVLVTRGAAQREEAPVWRRLAARLLRRRRVLVTHCVARLIERASSPSGLDERAWDEARGAFVDELGRNVEAAETANLAGEPLAADALVWLGELVRWARRVEGARGSPHASARLLRGLGRRPLRVEPGGEASATPTRAQRARSAVVRALLDEASVETDRLGRRQRLLERARRALLAGTSERSVEGSPDTARLLDLVAFELLEGQRMLAAGVRADVPLRAQLDRAIDQGSPSVATLAAAATLLGAPLPRPLGSLASLTARRGSLAVRRGSLAASAPPSLRTEVSASYARALRAVEDELGRAAPARALALRRQRSFLTADADETSSAAGVHRALRAVLLADARFDLGGGLARGYGELDEGRDESVREPSERLRLEPAERVEDLANAVIDDPRRIVHALASGELLTRRYLRARTSPAPRPGLRAGVRLFLLDGSSSMRGARARVRDAVFLGELAALAERLGRGGKARDLLYYRYFHTESEPVRRVRTRAEALLAMDDVVRVERSGGTDLEGALADALRTLDWARSHDVALSRAQLVLVSDGEAPIDPEALARLRHRLDVPLSLAVIALGGTAASLRTLASSCRDEGLDALLHHVSDAELDAWEAADDAVATSYEAAPESDVREALAALSALPERERRLPPEDPRALEAAWAEVGLDASALDEHTRARHEAAWRDVRALEARFDRLVPPSLVGLSTLGGDDEPDLARIEDLFAALAELATPGSTPLERRSDTLAVLLRALAAAGISLARYEALLRAHPARLGEAARALRAALALER